MTDAPAHQDLGREKDAERRAWLRACQFAWLSLGVFWLVASLSIQTEFERVDAAYPPFYPWVIEGTSVVVTAAIIPFIMWMGVRFPIEPGRWRGMLPIHLAGFLVYTSLHIAGMVGGREAVWALAYGADYEFFHNGEYSTEIIYEMRKDAATYAGYQVMVAVARALQFNRLEVEAARAEARRSHRLTLKCGGRTMRIDADAFQAAKAAGNYVEVSAGGAARLARMTLAELERQLAEAGVDAVRVHRSWLVNRDAIAEIVPTGEGDVTITLEGGETIPGSRRYRTRLDAA